MNVFQNKYPTKPEFTNEFICKGVYRRYVIKLRQLELQDIYVHITKTDHAEKLTTIIKNFDDIEYLESNSHTLFGKFKLFVVSFVDFWNLQIDAVKIAIDKHQHLSAKYEVIQILQETIEMQKIKQDIFRGNYLPVYTDEEAELYDNVETEYEKYITRLEGTVEYRILNLKYDNPDLTKKYIDELVTATEMKTYEIIKFTQDFIIEILVKCMPYIRNSLLDIHNRMANNLLEANTNKEEYVKELWHRLYEKNKEMATTIRAAKKSSCAIATLQESIDHIRDKFENDDKMKLIRRLQEEVKYWESKKDELEGIMRLMTKLNQYEEYLYKQERIHKAVENSTHPGQRRPCFEELGKKIEQRKRDVKKYKQEAKNMLITFFAVRGHNHMHFYDSFGKFFVDSYGHNTYIVDKGADRLHFDCEGNLFPMKDCEVYYFDENGRYLKKPGGEKVYKRSNCGSDYKLAPTGLLVKTSKDCGHSFTVRKDCKFEPPNPTDIVILPEAKPINIDNTLNPDTVKYLWDTFGSVLPETLNQVGVYQPRNPIQYFAQRLIRNRYAMTNDEFKAKNEEAHKYRDNVMTERQEKIKAAKKLWKKTQMKRVKPEETVDGLDWMAYNAYTAEHTFIDQICTLLY